ncbi:RTA1-domain-containing protein [Periconia macrospinosa]|uniref:RTA1-domain-containing protein n=1 Tax=Periconia macrospinosa TaxID=97972 RepID=A0A2V1DXC3_9PLEO|nr:RTA1-domain-containing protein [Periconia macrospinosa]
MLRNCTRKFEADKCPLEYAKLQYRPSVVGNVIYMICFFILLGGQAFFGIRTKTYKYCAVVCLGIIGEIVGYIGRLMLYNNPYSMDSFLTNLVPLTIAPALITGGIYLCLGRVITAIGAENSRIGPKMYTYIFVGSDLFSLILQAVGGAMASMATDKDGQDLGVRIMIAGLIFQVVSMTVFFAIWGDFVLRTRKAKMSGSLARLQPPLYAHLRDDGLGVATILIYIRCIYRVAELWGGFQSHLANDEATFMIFEGPMIIIAVSAMTMFHPGTSCSQVQSTLKQHFQDCYLARHHCWTFTNRVSLL